MTSHLANSDKILFLLKTKGALTSKTLAEGLNMTSMGARQHLLQLEQQLLVCSFNRAEKVGRPSQYWQLTESAHQRFPNSHGQLTVSLIQSVRNLFGKEGLEKLIAERENLTLTDYREQIQRKEGLESKLELLSSLRNGEGYMAEWQKKGDDYWFLENHCPICAAAKECQNFCSSELALFRRCLGDDVTITREEHILSGARRCAYKISLCSKQGALV